MADHGGAQTVSVDGRTLRVTNLDKPLYPDGTTKGDVLRHVLALAPGLLPRVADRPVSLRRWPDGTAGSSFVQKHAKADTPDWVRTESVEGRGHDPVRHAVLDSVAALVWAANLAALELHVPQWRFDGHERRDPDLLVLDLDPGEPADVLDCARVAVLLRERLHDDGLTAFPKTSGGKGLHLLVPVTGGDTSGYAKALATALAGDHPDLVVATMAKVDRPGKVFLDWSQNNPAKTTIAAWSLRGRDTPTVSTPLTWDEVAAAAHDEVGPDALSFSPDEAAARLDAGDPLADLTSRAAPLPG
ncbi:non-homologous end-joining DNA ligase [Rhodococcus aerolatus]